MNATLSQIADYLWSQSWQVAVLAAGIGVVTCLLRNRSAHVRYFLWLLVPAKCLVPPILGIALPILPRLPEAVPIHPPDRAHAETGVTAVVEAPPADLALPWDIAPDQTGAKSGLAADITLREAMAIAWLAGIVTFFAAVAWKAGRMTRWLFRERRIPPEGVRSELCGLLPPAGGRRMPNIWLLEGIGQPFVWGLFRGDIYLPASFASVDRRGRQKDVLAHEFSHVLRCDAAINLLQVVSQALFWFHPLVWWANRQIRAEREKSCDEMAIARLGARPREYSRAIVETLLNEHSSLRQVPSLAVAGPVKNIEERIKTMLQPGKRFYGRPSLFAASLVLLLAILIVPTSLALTGRPSRDPDTTAVTQPPADRISQQRTISAENLKDLAQRLNAYAQEHQGRYPRPDDIMRIIGDDPDMLGIFLLERVEYLGAGRTRPTVDASAIPLAFDIPLLRTAEGTNVAFADGHVEFIRTDQLASRGVTIREARLEVTEVRFDPIHQGKNAVHVTVRNTSDREQVFAGHIYTRSPDYGVSEPDPNNSGVGWGTSGYFDRLRPGETKSLRLVFKIQGPVTGRTYVNLRFSNPETQEAYDDRWCFFSRQYASAEMPKAGGARATPDRASAAEASAVTQAFAQVQSDIRNRQYEQAWQRFTEDFRKAEYQRDGLQAFRKAMEPTHPLHSAFTWERDDFLRLAPQGVTRTDGVFALRATCEGQTWTIDFVREDDLWKIDWIAGYTPRILDIQKQDREPATTQVGNNTATGNLRILDVRLDPIQSGRNTVHLRVQNTSQTDQVFGLDIRTESRDGNWQRQFTRSIQAGRTETMRFDFEILGSLKEASSIGLCFYNPSSLETWTIDDWMHGWFEKHLYTGEKFDQHEVSYGGPQTPREDPPATRRPTNLKVLDTQFDPIQKGKNAVRIQVQNLTEQDQVFAVSVQARSPDVGGWGTVFLETIQAGQTQWTRCAFAFRGTIAGSAHVELSSYNPGPAAGFDAEKWFASEPWDLWFDRHKYFGRDLPQRDVARLPLPAASQDQAKAALDALDAIQTCVRQKQYEDAWSLFTRDYRDAGYFRKFAIFKDRMEQSEGPDGSGGFRKAFLGLKPGSVAVRGNALVVTAAYEQQKWTIDLVQEDGLWKVDWIDGDADNQARETRWEDSVLPKMEKRSTAHFDIYYLKDSTAARQIDQIAQDKDRGFDEICRFLGKDSDVRIRLVLFEDGDTKRRATGHQGAGWAYGTTIVEIYNEKEHLDPYHETTHILMGPLGNPPALLNEGFATYMSEALGAPALENLGGGKTTLHQRVRDLKAKGDWIPLSELLGYTEIGSARSRPFVAYPEAGSFVQFLIDAHGKDKFLQTYTTLQNSDQQTTRKENAQRLAQICGQSLDSLEKQWLDVVSRAK
ncbi:MAG: M56 family metallopeptidase [Phycisphaerae bacterium]|nr:M56 family metallopeptidase [Phycisphaerae bacterium]